MRPVRLLVVLMVFPLLIACLQGAPAGGDMAEAEGVDVAAQAQPEVLTPKGDPESILNIILLAWRVSLISDFPTVIGVQDLPEKVGSWPADGILDPDRLLEIKIPSEGTFRLPLLVEIARSRDEEGNPLWFSHFRGPRIRVIHVPPGQTSPARFHYTDTTVIGVQGGGYNTLFTGLPFNGGDLLIYYHEDYRNTNESEMIRRFQSEEAYRQFLSDPYTHFLGSLRIHPED